MTKVAIKSEKLIPFAGFFFKFYITQDIYILKSVADIALTQTNSGNRDFPNLPFPSPIHYNYV